MEVKETTKRDGEKGSSPYEYLSNLDVPYLIRIGFKNDAAQAVRCNPLRWEQIDSSVAFDQGDSCSQVAKR